MHTDGDSLQTMLDWTQEILHLSSSHPLLRSEVIVQTPWSQVIKIHTDQDIVYLKKTPALFALEPKILSFLHNKLQASVQAFLLRTHA